MDWDSGVRTLTKEFGRDTVQLLTEKLAFGRIVSVETRWCTEQESGTLRWKGNRGAWEKWKYIDHEGRKDVCMEDKVKGVDEQWSVSASKSGRWNFLHPLARLYILVFAWSMWRIGVPLQFAHEKKLFKNCSQRESNHMEATLIDVIL